MVFSTIIFLLRFLPITLALYYLAPPKLRQKEVVEEEGKRPPSSLELGK